MGEPASALVVTDYVVGRFRLFGVGSKLGRLTLGVDGYLFRMRMLQQGVMEATDGDVWC